MSRSRRVQSGWAVGLGAIASLIALSIAARWIAWGTWAAGGKSLERGASAYGRGEWRAAEAEARAVLKARPADTVALRLLARASARQGKDEAAETIYRRLGTRRMEAEDLFLLGRGLLGRGQVGPALASLGAARDVQPDHAETLDALARYWAGIHSMTDALEAAERLSHRPGWEVRGSLLLGRLRSELLNPTGAADTLAAALERDPGLNGIGSDPREIEKLLVRCLLECGRPAEARERLQHLDGSGNSTDPEAAWLLGRALLQEGRIADAGAALQAARGFGAKDPMLREPAPFVGARTCAPCHPDQFESQQSSRHARTLLRVESLAALSWPDRLTVDSHNPVVRHRLGRVGERVEATAEVDHRMFRAVVAYALGSNHQGQSFLARDEQGRAYELRISRYPQAPEWDRTTEHPAVPSEPSGYLGRPVSSESVRKCLHCHATNFRAALEPAGRPEAGDRGIGCERCHGPGGHHAAAVAAHFPGPAIARPRLASAARVVALCAECHTAPPSTPPAAAGFVRYQASGLVLSRCYTRSGEAFGCVTCHDPHKDAEPEADSYQAVCFECHASPRRPAKGPEAARGRSGSGPACPVNPRADCLSCHMPKVKDAVPRTVFTDHWIRIHRP